MCTCNDCLSFKTKQKTLPCNMPYSPKERKGSCPHCKHTPVFALFLCLLLPPTLFSRSSVSTVGVTIDFSISLTNNHSLLCPNTLHSCAINCLQFLKGFENSHQPSVVIFWWQVLLLPCSAAWMLTFKEKGSRSAPNVWRERCDPKQQECFFLNIQEE